MKKLFYIALLALPAGMMAQDNGKQSHDSDPKVVKTGNPEKKPVDPSKKKVIVFTEKPERVIIDSTGKEIRISLEQPSITPPKKD